MGFSAAPAESAQPAAFGGAPAAFGGAPAASVPGNPAMQASSLRIMPGAPTLPTQTSYGYLTFPASFPSVSQQTGSECSIFLSDSLYMHSRNHVCLFVCLFVCLLLCVCELDGFI